MADFEVVETDQFKMQMEEAVAWLYSHNLETSQEFADKKLFELQQEVDELKNHLRKTPSMGQLDDLRGTRRFPLYDGHFAATWLFNEKSRSVALLEFIDSKYPRELRSILFDE